MKKDIKIKINVDAAKSQLNVRGVKNETHTKLKMLAAYYNETLSKTLERVVDSFINKNKLN